MLKIGLVGLDTSHAEAFAEQLSARDDAILNAVWDGGEVRDGAYVKEFCAEHNAAQYEQPTDMIGSVDAAMVLTVNWNTHRPLAVPFLEADVPVFIDKPVAGCYADLEAIMTAAGETPLFGGSAVPFHPKLEEFPIDQQDRAIYCAGYNDVFYYGVHLTDTVCRLVDDSWAVVSPCDTKEAVVDVEFINGSSATLKLDGPDDDGAFGILDVHDRTRVARIAHDSDEYERMYARFIDAFIAVLKGDRESNNRIMDGASLLLAVKTALRMGESITPNHEELAETHVNSEKFLADYAPYA